jgi:hypothetical protein
MNVAAADRPESAEGAKEPTSAQAAPAGRAGFAPRGVWIVALLAGLLHIAPFWQAQLSTPDGWRFAENLTVSPDYLQYRVWTRQVLSEGPVVENRFTTEPHAAYLPVFFYWVVGHTARLLAVPPERVYAYAGIPLAIALTLLVWTFVRHFVGERVHGWWIFLAIMFGGGLGAHLKLLAELPPFRGRGITSRLLLEPLELNPPFEDYRSHYVVKTLLDSHFLLIWIGALLAVGALWLAIRRRSTPFAIVTGALFAANTFLHVYEAVTLMAIAMGVALCCWAERDARRAIVTTLLWAGAGAALAVGVIARWVAIAGLPAPPWRAVPILFLILLIAYPVAWGLIAWGGREFWRRAQLPERFLVGWALGCTVLTLSAPLYPYPDRGTMTMQVPLMLIAGLVWFAHRPRLTRRAFVVALLLMGATPLWLAARTVYYARFRDDAPFAFLSPDHQAHLAALEGRAAPGDVLVAEGRDLLWLGPTFPGRLYNGHFFLTVDFERKDGEVMQLLEGTGEPDWELLRRTGATWLFVRADRSPERFASRLVPVARNGAGWLFTTNAARRASR